MNVLTKTVIRAAKKGAFKAQKHLPEILMVVGVGLGIASTVTACKATMKAKPIIDDAKDELDIIHKAADDNPEYADAAAKKDITRVYFNTGTQLGRLYAPSVGLGVASLACMIGSNVVLGKRLSAAIAAYAALDNNFRNYRDRVKNALGEDKELEVYHNAPKLPSGEDEQEIEIIADDSDAVEIDGYSIYARRFDKHNKNWKNDTGFNLMWLRGVQRYCQNLLETYGFLSLNRVYEELGMKKNAGAQIVGWIYDPDNPNHKGDNVISFGLYDPVTGALVTDAQNTEDNSLILDFNIDGVIIDRI